MWNEKSLFRFQSFFQIYKPGYYILIAERLQAANYLTNNLTTRKTLPQKECDPALIKASEKK
jgi:hypothetical protein